MVFFFWFFFTYIVLLYVFWTVGLFYRSDMLYFIAWFYPCFFTRLVLSILSLALRAINTTLGLPTFPRHVMARSGGRASLFIGLLTECMGTFTALSPSCYAILVSYKKSETAVYGCNSALLKFYQCSVDVLQSQIFLRSQISLAAVFVI